MDAVCLSPGRQTPRQGHVVRGATGVVTHAPSGSGQRDAEAVRSTTVPNVVNSLVLVFTGPARSLETSGPRVFPRRCRPEGRPRVSRPRVSDTSQVKVSDPSQETDTSPLTPGAPFSNSWRVVCRRSLVRVVHSRVDTSHGGITAGAFCASLGGLTRRGREARASAGRIDAR